MCIALFSESDEEVLPPEKKQRPFLPGLLQSTLLFDPAPILGLEVWHMIVGSITESVKC